MRDRIIFLNSGDHSLTCTMGHHSCQTVTMSAPISWVHSTLAYFVAAQAVPKLILTFLPFNRILLRKSFAFFSPKIKMIIRYRSTFHPDPSLSLHRNTPRAVLAMALFIEICCGIHVYLLMATIFGDMQYLL